jgi:hypothetical protein
MAQAIESLLEAFLEPRRATNGTQRPPTTRALGRVW